MNRRFWTLNPRTRRFRWQPDGRAGQSIIPPDPGARIDRWTVLSGFQCRSGSRNCARGRKRRGASSTRLVARDSWILAEESEEPAKQVLPGFVTFVRGLRSVNRILHNRRLRLLHENLRSGRSAGRNRQCCGARAGGGIVADKVGKPCDR